MSEFNSTADITAVGRGGYGLGGSGIWDIIALGLFTNGGFFGNDRKYDCCPQPATCESVAACDRDVLATANETQGKICESTNEIITAINTGNYALSDKISNGFYALNDKVSGLAYAQQSLAKDTQTLIVSKFAELETKQLAAANCALEQEVNRFKTVAMLQHCGGHPKAD